MRKDIKDYIETMKIKNINEVVYASVARQYDCDYRTVKKYYNERDRNIVKKRKTRSIKKKTDGLEELIAEKLQNNSPVISIYKVLKENHKYTGSYSTLKAYVHKLKKEKVEEVTIHFETSPGKQCQIDWKEDLTLVSNLGETFTINIFLTILGYSRLKYIELTTDKTQTTVFRCLTNSFKYYGGVPQELLFDNMRTVVDHSRTQYGKPVYNDKLYSFSKDAGFIPKSCLAYRPKTKGKVETVARVMNRLKAYNNEFSTLEELNQIVVKLNEDVNNEIHSVTKEKPFDRFKKEKEYLNPLPNIDILESYYSCESITRKVPKDCLITYQGLKYSVNPAYAGKSVTLEREGNNLCIYYNKLLVSSHTITGKSINYTENDYKALLSRSILKEENIERICEDNLKLFDKL